MCKNALSCRLPAMSEIGHREREKAKRRLAIEISALRLFAEKGFEETTIQEIAAAASVSPRTVLMYFPNKADIALSSVNMEVAILTERVRTESKKKSVMDIYASWFTEMESKLDPVIRDLRSLAFKRNPILTGSMSSEIQEAMEASSAALAREYEIPANHIGILLTLNLIGGLSNVLEQRSDKKVDILDAMRDALNFADAGIKALKKKSK